MNLKVGRNDPCPCGSGKKYKQCCLSKGQSSGKKTFTATNLTGKAQNLFSAVKKVVKPEKKEDE